MAKKHYDYEPDLFQGKLRGPLEWVANHTNIFVIVIVTVFLVMTGMVFISKALSARDDRAWEAVAAALEPVDAMRGPQDPERTHRVAENLIAVGKSHAGTPAEGVALLRAGMLYLDLAVSIADDEERKAELDLAGNAVAEFLGRCKGHPMTPFAHQAMGQIHEESGRFEEAAGEFKEALKSDPDIFLKPKLEYDIGRVLYLTGEFEESRPWLERAAWDDRRYPGLRQGMDYLWRENANYLLSRIAGKGEAEPASDAPAEDDADAPEVPAAPDPAAAAEGE